MDSVTGRGLSQGIAGEVKNAWIFTSIPPYISIDGAYTHGQLQPCAHEDPLSPDHEAIRHGVRWSNTQRR